MKRKLVIGCGVLVALAAIGVVAFIVFVVNAAKAPYAIESSRISAENISTKDTFGRYKKIVVTGSDNPMTTEGLAVLFLSNDGKWVEQNSQTQIIIGEEKETYKNTVDSFIASIKARECNYTEGHVNDTRYFKATCGSTMAYIYLSGDKLVAFQVQGDEKDLADVIADFNK